jgi:2-polyprenyl-3-methyl-5-hydroxy-6-metoxy-1,4-benzoquinol methylase
MQYDPIKKSLGSIFNRSVFTRKLFYRLLDILLLRAWYVRKELRRFRKTKGGDADILDAGAGFGQYSYYMSTLSDTWRITAVDLKTEQVEDCNSFFSTIHTPQRVFFEEANLIAYRNPDKYDLVLSIDVMEHIEEDTLVFENFYLSLKKGGMLLISTPSDLGGSDVHHETDESFIDEHVRDGYNRERLSDTLRKTGFSKIDIQYSYGRAGMFSWKLSMKLPILMVNKSKLYFILLPLYYILTFPLSLLFNLIDVNKKQQTGSGLIVKAWK